MRKKGSLLKAFLILGVGFNMQACGSIQQMLQGTPTSTPTLTYTPTLTPTSTLTPTETLTPTSTPTPTNTPDLVATQKTGEFSEIVKTYFDETFLETVYDEYYALEDYVDSYAKKGFYTWSAYDLDIRNFILRTDVRLSTANNPSSSTACGIVFRTVGNFTESIFVQQDGNIYYGAGDTNFNSRYYGRIDNPAEFEVVLVVYEKSYRVFLDDKEVLAGDSILDVIRSGGVGFAVQAGTNEDFGSQCNFTDIDLWVINKK